MRLGLGLALTRRSGGGSGITTLSMTGLDTSAPTDAATPGDHLSISVGFPVGVTAWSSQTWGVGSYGDSTYGTGANPADYTASDAATLFWEGLGDDGNTYRASAAIRYAEGSVTETGTPFSWTIDDTTLNQNFAADFTTTNLTGSYVITGLPTGGVDDTDGTASGTLTGTPSSGNVTVTFTDQYGRTIVGTYAYTTSYRTQATAANLLGPFTWTVDDTAVSVDATTDFTANSNTLTYTATGLPAGVTIAANGTISGTPTAASSGSIVITGTDEYGRETTSTTSHTTSLRTQATAAGTLADAVIRLDQGLDSNEIVVSSDFTANGNTLTYTASGQPTGLSISQVGTFAEFVGTPTALQASTAATITATDEYSRTTDTTVNIKVHDVPDAFGDSDWSIADGGAGDIDVTISALPANNQSTITDIEYRVDSGTWTSSAATTSFTISGLDNGTTNVEIRAVNAAGSGAASSVKSATVTGATSAPTLDSVVFSDNNDGTDATLTITYTGSVVGYRVYIATGSTSLSVSAAQLYAASGGTGVLEFTDYAVGTTIDITGLTSTSEAATRIAVCLIKSADGTLPSNVETVVVSGLDFTAPSITWATNTAGDEIIGTAASGTLYFSQDTADWSISGVSAGTPTITSVTGSGTGTITIAISTNLVANGDTVTLSYTNSDTNLRDQDGNTQGNFTGTSVTNNVPAGSSGPTLSSTTGTWSNGTDGSYTWYSTTNSGATLVFSGGGDIEYCVIGAGGGGGFGNTRGAGGGGGGEVKTGSATIAAETLTATIGAGGTAGTAVGTATAGGASTLTGSTAGTILTSGGGGAGGDGDNGTSGDSDAASAVGGGGGGGQSSVAGGSTGAGGASTGTAGAGGNGVQSDANGGSAGGGGGGATGAGGNATASVSAGAGGTGTVNAYDGSSTTYGAGGAGGIKNFAGTGNGGGNDQNASAGTNAGDGGGGGADNMPTDNNEGGAGVAGKIIVRWLT